MIQIEEYLLVYFNNEILFAVAVAAVVVAAVVVAVVAAVAVAVVVAVAAVVVAATVVVAVVAVAVAVAVVVAVAVAVAVAVVVAVAADVFATVVVIFTPQTTRKRKFTLGYLLGYPESTLLCKYNYFLMTRGHRTQVSARWSNQGISTFLVVYGGKRLKNTL